MLVSDDFFKTTRNVVSFGCWTRRADRRRDGRRIDAWTLHVSMNHADVLISLVNERVSSGHVNERQREREGERERLDKQMRRARSNGLAKDVQGGIT